MDSQGQLNTPANERWELTISSRPIGALTENNTYITFASNGSIDLSRTAQADLAHANSFLAPAISNLHVQLNSTAFDFWELINWLFVSYYWTVLADFGQVAPTFIYEDDTISLFPPTNNIFVNQSLFAIYQSYLRETILPLLNGTQTYNHRIPIFPPFLDLGTNNTLSATPTEFIRGYSCVLRQRKKWLGLIISVIVADYAMIMAAYKVAIFIGKKIQEGRRPHRNLACINYTNGS